MPSPLYISNKKARYDYQVIEKFEAGMVLDGDIINHIRNKSINLSGKYIVFQKKQLSIIGLVVDNEQFSIPLLVTKKELRKIQSTLHIKGKSCVPLAIYRKKRWFKCEIALVQGRNKSDKKEYLKAKDIEKEMRREIHS